MKEKERSEQNQNFGLVMAAGFGALTLIRYLWTGSVTWWLSGLGALFLIAALVVPAWLGPIRAAWMKLAAVLGYLNSRILLTVVFAGLITPIALLLRLVGKQPIRLGFRGQESTYWHKREAGEFEAKRMERQF